MPGGRPHAITPEIGEEIAIRVSGGRTLLDVAHDPDLPCHQTIWKSLRENAEFAEAIARAKHWGAHFIAESVVEIADEAVKTLDPAKTQLLVNKCRQRQWIAGKYNSAYADTQRHEHTGADGGPIAHVVEERRRIAGDLLGQLMPPTIEHAPPAETCIPSDVSEHK